MTQEQADQLQAGDTIYTACWFVGSPPRIEKTTFRGKFHSPGALDYPYEIQNGSRWKAARLHHTWAEAHTDIERLMQTRIAQLQAQLNSWHSSVVPVHAD